MITVEGCKFNQVIASIAAAPPDVMHLQEEVNMASGTQHASTDLANLFFSIFIRKADLKQFVCTWTEFNIHL